MQLELKKIPSQVYEGKMALRYGFWTPTGEIKTKLKCILTKKPFFTTTENIQNL
jgi:hypothetical protein